MPDFARTTVVSPLLIVPSAFTSERKLVGLTPPPFVDGPKAGHSHLTARQNFTRRPSRTRRSFSARSPPRHSSSSSFLSIVEEEDEEENERETTDHLSRVKPTLSVTCQWSTLPFS